MHIVRYDAGRKHSKRPDQKNDCVIRVTAQAFGIHYDFAYDMFKYFVGRKSNDGCTLKQCKVIWNMFGGCKKLDLVSNAEMMDIIPTLSEMKGTYVISLPNDHITLFKKGKLYDIDMTKSDLFTSEVEAIYKILV